MKLMYLDTPPLALLFLIAFGCLSNFAAAIQCLGRLKTKEEIERTPLLFFYKPLLKALFSDHYWQGLLISLSFSRQLFLLAYSISACLLFEPRALPIAMLILAGLLVNFGSHALAVSRPLGSMRALSFPTSLFLILSTPITLLFLIFLRRFIPSLAHCQKQRVPLPHVRERIAEILHDSELSPYLDPLDHKSILSILSFKERIAREVMVPRIDLFGLSAETTIQEAAQSFLKERYSRIPVYRESVDHILGVLLYKDILALYARAESSKLLNPIETLVKPVLYTPETKKISHLLQEFRHKQIHMAIVVDEYGGTEGVVTIEDILEELVGEIADEYDVDEELLYVRAHQGGWIVDARMTIVDIEEELGIKIPFSAEYDTIGGYVFHRAGAITPKGWKLHHEDFDLEVLSSDERSIEKIHLRSLA